MKKLVTILIMALGMTSFSQTVDYDDLYFNSVDRKIVEHKNKGKKSLQEKKRITYLPSEHQDYSYYPQTEEKLKSPVIKKINLNCFFLMPYPIQNWVLFNMKNIHLIHPQLPIAFNYKYHSDIIIFPYSYLEGKQKESKLFWEMRKVKFWIIK